MAMKKAEMEEHRETYHHLMTEARSAERQGLYRKAVQSALEAWDHIDGMMQFEKRYGDTEFDSLSAIDLVLKYTPLLLDFETLDALEELLKSYRRIERDTSESLGERLQAARERMWKNHRLWDHLEQNPDARQDQLRGHLGGEQERWRAVAEGWEKMGLISRSPEGGSCRLALCTRLGEMVRAKCSSCGNTLEGSKGLFLEPMDCPRCQRASLFVILGAAAS